MFFAMKSLTPGIGTMLVVATLAFAGCKTYEGASDSSSSAMSSDSSGSLSAGDRSFLMKAAQGNMLEKQAAQVAEQKARSSEVKEFARMLASDHTQAGQQLQQLAQSKGVQLPQSLDSEHQAKVQKLQSASGQGFDAMFARDMGVKDHEEDIELFEQASKSSDPQISSFAQAQLPGLREHLEKARELAKTTSTRAASAE